MSIIGAHVVLYTTQPEQLRAALRDVFGWTHVDAGDGWLIFALPPGEVGVHPSGESHHELSLMCDQLEETVADLGSKGIEFQGDIMQRSFGRAVLMMLPGGVEVLLYEPRHPTAIDRPGGSSQG